MPRRLHISALFTRGTIHGLRRVMRNAILVVCITLAACSQTYHPEYHPVTVTTIHQGGAAPLGPVIIQDPPVANPEAFFER